MNQIKPFDITNPVLIYKNLTKKCWSIKQKGLVVAYTNNIILKDAICIVNKKGNEKVRQEKQKNVHAYIKGIIYTPLDELYFKDIITYNPYIHESFVRNNEPVYKLKYAQFTDKLRGII